MQSTHSAGSAHSASGSALVFPSPGLSAGSRQESFDPLSPSASQHAYHFHQQQAGYPSPSVASSEREEHLASGAASSSSFSHEVERELAGYPVAGALSNGGTGAGERSAAGSRQHSMDDGVSSAGIGGMRRAPSSSSLASSAAYNSSYDPHSTSNPYSLQPNQSNGTSSSSPSLPPLSHLHSSAVDDEGLGLGSIAESSSALPPSAPPAPVRRGSSTTALGLGSGIGLGMGLEGQQTGHGQGASSGWEEARTKVVDEGFDEAVLRGLCDLDVSRLSFSYFRPRASCFLLSPGSSEPTSFGIEMGDRGAGTSKSANYREACIRQCGMPLLLDRMKQSMASAAVSFRALASLSPIILPFCASSRLLSLICSLLTRA